VLRERGDGEVSSSAIAARPGINYGSRRKDFCEDQRGSLRLQALG
jgi:hypothetical protein